MVTMGLFAKLVWFQTDRGWHTGAPSRFRRMTSNIRQAVSALTAFSESAVSSGLLSAEDWAKAVAGGRGDAEETVKYLISNGLLTEFQIEALSEGELLRCGWGTMTSSTGLVLAAWERSSRLDIAA